MDVAVVAYALGSVVVGTLALSHLLGGLRRAGDPTAALERADADHVRMAVAHGKPVERVGLAPAAVALVDHQRQWLRRTRWVAVLVMVSAAGFALVAVMTVLRGRVLVGLSFMMLAALLGIFVPSARRRWARSLSTAEGANRALLPGTGL